METSISKKTRPDREKSKLFLVSGEKNHIKNRLDISGIKKIYNIV